MKDVNGVLYIHLPFLCVSVETHEIFPIQFLMTCQFFFLFRTHKDNTNFARWISCFIREELTVLGF